MNKTILILLLFLCFTIKANSSLTLTNPQSHHFSIKDIKTDTTQILPISFEKNFKKKYTSNDFQYEVKIAEKNWWDRFIEWLKELFKSLFGFTDNVSRSAVSWTINIIAMLIILFVIYLIVKAILNKEGRWIFGKSTVKKIISHDDIERNLKHIDFEQLIKDTLKSGNQRLSIRYYYLWILKKMSEKSLIEWNPEKTNSDYLYEIKSETLRKDFEYVSYLYNYVWYGEFELDQIEFENAKKVIEKMLQSIK